MKPITQMEMVAEVGRTLGADAGGPLLVTKSGSSFNPAAHASYTFNSVLKVWTRRRPNDAI